MSDSVLTALRDAIQIDPGGRGLATDPHDNLFTACAGDFEAACRSVATHPRPALAVVTGFFIVHADPPCGETDGPPGALFLARALVPLGIPVAVYTDAFCENALKVGLESCGLSRQVPVHVLPQSAEALDQASAPAGFQPTHLVALERPGPGADGRCRNMRGRDITAETAPAHRLFEAGRHGPEPIATIGIGDGGNEIGMGKIAADVIGRNVPNGAAIACRVATDHLIVAGISNWGAYALAAGVRHLLGAPYDPDLFDPGREQALLQTLVERGPLVDGPTGKRQATVDGLSFEVYARPLVRLGAILRG